VKSDIDSFLLGSAFNNLDDQIGIDETINQEEMGILAPFWSSREKRIAGSLSQVTAREIIQI
jgi:hypothetical protein